MRDSGRVSAAIELLTELSASHAPADVIFKKYTSSRRYIGSKDRRAIQEIFYGIIRNRGLLEWRLGHSTSDISPRLLVLAWLQHNAIDPLTVFGSDNYAPPPLTETEQKLLHNLQSMASEPPQHAIYNLSEWWLEQIQQAYPQNWQDILKHSMQEADVDLRVNSLKSSRQAVLKKLITSGIKAEPINFTEHGIRLAARQPMDDLLKNGIIEIQDAASQLVSAYVGAKRGERVLDYCAGAGGKSLAIAAAMQNHGELVATDKYPERLNELERRAVRAGISIIKTGLIDEAGLLQPESFDRVLIDAPCSGSGTWRRHPDARWRYGKENLAEFTLLQREILTTAAKYIRHGGMLFYSTCSLLPAENREQAEWLKENHQNFTILSAQEFVNHYSIEDTVSADIGLQIIPHLLKSDAQYVVAFIKK